MVEIDPVLTGIIIGIIGIVVTISVGYWQAKRKEVGRQSGIKTVQKKKKLKSNKEKGLKNKNLIDDIIKVPSGSSKKISFDLKQGEIIKGIIDEVNKYDFNFYVMNEPEYSNYRNDDDFNPIFDREGISSCSIKITIPYDDKWYFVFDTYGKQINRKIKIQLRKVF